MKRINAIIKYIKPNSIVIDVGSDHALLSTSLTKCTSMKHIYNIEKNLGPLNRTIQNTKTIKNITNIHANGLDFKINEMKIDYCVIAGMGGNNIINILQHVNSKKCQTFILQPSNNTSDLRRFLAINGYFIVCEEIIEEKDIYYDLIVVNKHNGLPIISAEDLFFGPYNLRHRSNEFITMYTKIKQHILNNNLHALNSAYCKQLTMINNL